MKKLSLVTLTLLLALTANVYSQSLGYSGGLCAGSFINIYLMGGPSCGSPTVPSTSNWTINPAPSSITYIPQGSNNYPQIQVKWNTAVSAAIRVSYSCPSGGNSGQTNDLLLTIAASATPSVSLAINTTNVCYQSGGLVLTATPTNGGGSPSYNYYVDGVSVYNGNLSSYTYNAGGLSVGSHSTYVTMNSSLACTTPSSSATSTSKSFTIVAKSSYTASISGPGTICSYDASGTFMASTANGVGTMTYQWYLNDNAVGSATTSPSYTFSSLSSGNTIYCRATSDYWCVNTPVQSNTYTVVITPSVTPTVSIQVPKLNYCTGETINFSSSISGPAYSWKLNGVQFSTSNASSLPISTNTITPNTFSPGDVVTLDVTGLSGICLTSSTASATTAAMGIVVHDYPAATISPTGSLKIKFTAMQTISASTGAGYYYTWMKGGVPIPEANNSTYLTNQAGAYSYSVNAYSCISNSGTLNITVNQVPYVDAGLDQSPAFPVSSVVLQGSASDPEPGGGISSLLWTQISGPTVSISSPTTTTTTIANPPIGNYTFQLKATDNTGDFSVDYVDVAVFPVNNYNYIREQTVQVKGINSYANVAPLQISLGSKSESYTYFDGLGRSVEMVNTQASPLLKDIVQPAVYDAFAREKIKYLPYVSTELTGYYKSNPVGTTTYVGSTHYNYYNNGTGDKVKDDAFPFSETFFEASPLNRPDKNYGVGKDWRPVADGGANKYIQHQYLVNIHSTTGTTTQEKVIVWELDASGMPLRDTILASYIETGGYYSSNQLIIKSTIDEKQNAVREYTNKAGQVVLKKVQVVAASTNLNSLTDWAMTYYIYDDFGNLRYVLPPELSKIVYQNDTYVPTATDLNNFAFQYKYDGRRRMIEKTVPGTSSVYMVYDNRDRLVLTQDGNQRAGLTNAIKYWMFIKYDGLNRPIATGIKDTTTTVQLTQAQMQAVVDTYYALIATTKPWRKYGESFVGAGAANNVHGYTNYSYPRVTNAATLGPYSYLTVTYYDDYVFRGDWVGAYTYVDENLSQTINTVTYTQPDVENLVVVGKVTGTKTKVLDGGVRGGYTWLNTINYYDDKYRVVQVLADNYKGGIDRVSNLYDFTGNILKSNATHFESDVVWIDKVSVLQVGNKLYKTASGNGWVAGAASAQQLPGGQNGWMEFVASEITLRRVVGLSDANTNVNYTTIDYGWDLNAAGVLKISESGTNRGTFGTYKSGDVLRIERTGTVVKYYQNGVLKYTSGVASSTLLMVDVSFYTLNASVTNVRASFGSTTRTIARRMDYDHSNRLIRAYHQIDTQPEILLTHNSYNELGQPIDKKLHSTNINATDAKQSVDFRYNIRGWLTSINNSSLSNDGVTNDDTGDYFGMNLGYNTDLGMGNGLLYDGNISAMKWSNFLGQAAVKEKSYTFAYDPLNRLTSATFKEKTGSWAQATNNGFSAPTYTYDLNGNIKSLTRHDIRGTSTIMDNLVYDYGTGTTLSNKLLTVTDNGDDFKGFSDGTNTGNDYTYDANGNLITDQNKGITAAMTYNYLNLPEVVTRGGNSIRYVYDAAGRKLSQLTTFTGTVKQTDYVGGFIYENDALQFVNHEEGRIVVSGTTLIYTNSGESTEGITASNATLAAVTLNGEKYIKATSTSTVARSGMFPIGGAYPVVAGEKYKIRAKGYRDKGTAASSNPAYLLIKANGVDVGWPGAALPGSVTTAQTESWAEQIVTIPAGATVLQVGLVWSTVLSGEIIYLNEFEVSKLDITAPEYQYDLKDHLGNVRLTFTTKLETESVTATLETANASAESGKFLRFDNARLVNHYLFDKTNGSAPTTVTGNAQRLSGQTNEVYGLARSISVMPGDVINMQVYAKYIDSNHSNWTTAINTLLTQIAAGTAPPGTVLDGGNYSVSTSSFPFTAGLNGTAGSSGSGPKAYLNWLVFDRNYNLITAKCGYKRMSTAAREYGQDVTHELLTGSVSIAEPGYVYIYLSNEEGVNPYEVYFDGFKVDQIKGPIIASQDYYPFGLTFNSYTRENSVKQDYQYNSKELQDELNLGWLDYGARMYDMAIGRFTTLDPLATNFSLQSPYVYAINNPVRFTDYRGMGPKDEVDKVKITSRETTVTNKVESVSYNKKTQEYTVKETTKVNTTITASASNKDGSVTNYTASQTKTTSSTTVVNKQGDVTSAASSTITTNELNVSTVNPATGESLGGFSRSSSSTSEGNTVGPLASLAQNLLSGGRGFPILDDYDKFLIELYNDPRDPDSSAGVGIEILVMKSQQYKFMRSGYEGFDKESSFNHSDGKIGANGDYSKYQQKVDAFGKKQDNFGVFIDRTKN